jgi:hypothetical protein
MRICLQHLCNCTPSLFTHSIAAQLCCAAWCGGQQRLLSGREFAATQHTAWHEQLALALAQDANTHPPGGMKDGEGQVVHDTVGMAAVVAMQLDADSKAFDTQVKVGTVGALDAHVVRYVTVAVVAVIQRPVMQGGAQLVYAHRQAACAGHSAANMVPTRALLIPCTPQQGRHQASYLHTYTIAQPHTCFAQVCCGRRTNGQRAVFAGHPCIAAR